MEWLNNAVFNWVIDKFFAEFTQFCWMRLLAVISKQ